MAVYALGEHVPDIHPTAYVHPDGVVIGQVTLGAESTVWPGAVLRGDHGPISVGERTSIQDGTVVHAASMAPTIIGSDCVIGHIAHLEGCVIEDKCLVGSGSIVLHHAIVRTGSLIGAGALVPNRKEVPSGAMALGVPAQIKEGAVQPGQFEEAVRHYVASGRRYREQLRRLD